MARFYWDDESNDNLVRTREFQEIHGSQEFMLSDPQVEPYLHKAQMAILNQFSDKDIIFKIKGNISKLMTLESGFKTPVPYGPLLRGLDGLIRLAEQRHTRAAWDHEALQDVAENMREFYAKLKNHPHTPKDVLARIGEEVGLETVSFRDILTNIFGLSNIRMVDKSTLESGQKIALESALNGIKNATANLKGDVSTQLIDA